MLLPLCAFKLPWGVCALENTNVDWALYKINLLLFIIEPAINLAIEDGKFALPAEDMEDTHL